MVLFGQKSRESFEKERLVEDIYAAQQKSLELEKWFLAKSSDGVADEYSRLALICHQCAKIIEECADLVSQMLPPRDKRKAKIFEAKARELLANENKFLRESWTFEYPITNGTLVAIANELRSLILDFTAI